MNGGGTIDGVRRVVVWRGRAFGALVALGACSLAGCKGESSTGGGGSGGSTSTAAPIASADYPDAFAKAFCAIGPCCQREGYAFTQTACESGFEAAIAAEVSNYLAVPGVEFDEDAAGACMQALRAAVIACTDRVLLDAEQTVCVQVFRGTVPEGGSCTANAACAPIPGAGEVSCNDKGVCARGNVTGLDTTLHAKLGEPCAGTCESNLNGSSCEGFGTKSGAPTGDPACYRDDGLYCTDAFVCAALPKVGESCGAHSECSADTYCSGGVCVAAMASGPCEFDECLHTSYCDTTTNMCTPRKANGAACKQDRECSSGNCDGVCHDWSLARGDRCSGSIN